MLDEFAHCMVTNSRMAARAVTRRYDAYLRPYGLTATQLSLLGAIGISPGMTVSALAESRGFERTTLTRNLDKLEQRGLVRSTAERGRVPHLTPECEELLAQLLPMWRKAQEELRAEISPETFDDTVKSLKRLAKV